jgi:hypothetical protein
LRKSAIERIGGYFRGDMLSTMLSRIYFGDVHVSKKDYRILVTAMKETITSLYMSQEVEKSGGDC